MAPEAGATTLLAPPYRRPTETFEAFDLSFNPSMRAAYERCMAVCFGGAWCAFLAGPDKGTGKTHLAKAALTAWPGPIVFHKVGDLLGLLRDEIRKPDGDPEAMIRDLQTDVIPGKYGQTTGGIVTVIAPQQLHRLAVFDELGIQNATGFAEESLYRILDARYEARLPTIITTNVDQNRIDDRLKSRYAEGLVVCRGADYRRRKEAN